MTPEQYCNNYSVTLYISQLKKRVEELSKRKLDPFQLIQYRTATGSEPMTAHYLAQVGAMSIEAPRLTLLHLAISFITPA